MFLFSPYRAVLRAPYARGAFVASLVGRLCYGIVSLSMILTLTTGGRNYAFAGFVMALLGLAIVLVSPFRARLLDRYGPRWSLPPMAACFAAVLIAIAVIPARSGAGDAAIAVLAAVAGACAPPLGIVMRTLWSDLIDDRGLLQTAYSLDGVAEELLYVAGPAITGFITVVAKPAVGLLVTAGLAVAGTGLFLRSPGLGRRKGAAKPSSRTRSASPGTAGTGRAILALALATAAVGLCLGGLGLVIVAFSQARHDPAAVAWIEAALSAGSALGGLIRVRKMLCPLAPGRVASPDLPQAEHPRVGGPYGQRAGRLAGSGRAQFFQEPREVPGVAEAYAAGGCMPSPPGSYRAAGRASGTISASCRPARGPLGCRTLPPLPRRRG